MNLKDCPVLEGRVVKFTDDTVVKKDKKTGENIGTWRFVTITVLTATTVCVLSVSDDEVMLNKAKSAEGKNCRFWLSRYGFESGVVKGRCADLEIIKG